MMILWGQEKEEEEEEEEGLFKAMEGTGLGDFWMGQVRELEEVEKEEVESEGVRVV